MTATVTHPATSTKVRLHFVDNLRVYLTVLVLAHHVALAYGNLPIWPYREPPATPAEGIPLDLLVALNQAYFMGFFFLLSGFFTPGSLDRKGPRRFSKDRLKRLGLPLLGFLVLLRPLYTLVGYLDQPADDRPAYWVYYLTSIDPGPMWFVEVLLVFALAYALIRRRNPAPPTPPVDENARPLRAWQIVAFALGLAAVSYVWRIAVPVGMYIPVLGLPSPAYLLQYASLFAVGILAYRRNWFQTLPRWSGWLGAGLLTASLAPLVLSGAASVDDTPAPGSLPTLAIAMWDSMFAVGAILVLFRIFRRFFNREGRLGAFLSRNAFAVYVIHPPVVVACQLALSGIELPAVPKFALVLALVVVMVWPLAALVRKLPGARTVL